MKKTKKNKKNFDIFKSKDDEEYESLQMSSHKKKFKKYDNSNETISKYKSIIRLFSYIIAGLILLIIILFFSKSSKNENQIQNFNNKQILIGNENKNINDTKFNNSFNLEYKTIIEHNNINNINNISNHIVQNNNQTGGKRKIYVQYMDFWPAFELERFDVHRILKEKYEVIISENPDYVIFGEFGGENNDIENRFDCVKLFLSIENRYPNMDITDYAIGIHYLDFGDRYFRKPTETHQLSAIYSVYNVTKVKGIDIKKKKFCAWVVSNGSGEVRNKFYDRLSEYKVVDSGGSFRNNVGGPVDDKLGFLANYKFSICFENSKTEGYISEKLSDAFEAGTIPIYYGDDSVLKLLNNRAYIHVRDENEFDEKIELIKKIDQNDTLYEEVIREKIVLDDSQYPRELQKYKDFIYHIIEQDKQKAKRFERRK